MPAEAAAATDCSKSSCGIGGQGSRSVYSLTAALMNDNCAIKLTIMAFINVVNLTAFLKLAFSLHSHAAATLCLSFVLAVTWFVSSCPGARLDQSTLLLWPAVRTPVEVRQKRNTGVKARDEKGRRIGEKYTGMKEKLATKRL